MLITDTDQNIRFHPFWLSGNLVVFLYRRIKFKIAPKLTHTSNCFRIRSVRTLLVYPNRLRNEGDGWYHGTGTSRPD